MAAGLVGLLDDVAALAKLAAASIDDVGVAASRASLKAAGVVIDDAAVTPQYVHGLAAERELPIIRKIAIGSLRNKLLFILPVALVLSAFAPKLVEILLMAGGLFLCYEGAHKVIHYFRGDDHDHDVPVAAKGPDAENEAVSSAIRTDLILSAEIMIIALKEVLDQGLLQRSIILILVGILITVVVYGTVALIVKMDDFGLTLAERSSSISQRIGRMLVAGMPKVLTLLSVVGTAAMLWVGGHILLVGAQELGWHLPYSLVHHAEEAVRAVVSLGGVLPWLATTILAAIVGLALGALVVFMVENLSFGSKESSPH